MDRIENRVETARAKFRERITGLSKDKVRELEKTSEITFEEHFSYQETQARAHAMEIISTSEAQIVYAALGEVGSPDNGGWAPGTDLATKLTVTQLMAELLKLQLALR